MTFHYVFYDEDYSFTPLDSDIDFALAQLLCKDYNIPDPSVAARLVFDLDIKDELKAYYEETLKERFRSQARCAYNEYRRTQLIKEDI